MNNTHEIKLPYSGRRKSLGFQSYVVARLLFSNCGVPQYLQKNFSVLQNLTTVTGLVIPRLKNDSAQVMLDYDNLKLLNKLESAVEFCERIN